MYDNIYIVYKTTNLINNKIYVGEHKQKLHFPVIFDNYLGSGVLLRRAIRKYGTENFIRETLFVYTTIEEAFAKEREIVNEVFITRNDVYNLQVGGTGNDSLSDDIKIILSSKKKGTTGYWKDKTLPDCVKNKISSTLKNIISIMIMLLKENNILLSLKDYYLRNRKNAGVILL